MTGIYVALERVALFFFLENVTKRTSCVGTLCRAGKNAQKVREQGGACRITY